MPHIAEHLPDLHLGEAVVPTPHRGAGDSFPVRIGKSFLKAWVRRRAINELARLDNHLLRDLGLDRDRIPDTVDAMLDRKPSSPSGAPVHYLFDKEEKVLDGYPARAAA